MLLTQHALPGHAGLQAIQRLAVLEAQLQLHQIQLDRGQEEGGKAGAGLVVHAHRLLGLPLPAYTLHTRAQHVSATQQRPAHLRLCCGAVQALELGGARLAAGSQARHC